MVVVPQPDADGAAGPGQHGRHGEQVDDHVGHALQDQLLVHDGLERTRTETGLGVSSLWFDTCTSEGKASPAAKRILCEGHTLSRWSFWYTVHMPKWS